MRVPRGRLGAGGRSLRAWRQWRGLRGWCGQRPGPGGMPAGCAWPPPRSWCCACWCCGAVRYLPERDDYAYRALVVAMTDGHLFTLSGAQADALAVRLAPQLGGRRLGPGPGGGPVQWVRLPGGGWVSEKDPGSPYLAVAFQAVGLIGWRRCCMPRWPAWAWTPGAGAGSAGPAARPRPACTAPRVRPFCSAGVLTCRPLPRPR